jgi:hypothetical protein
VIGSNAQLVEAPKPSPVGVVRGNEAYATLSIDWFIGSPLRVDCACYSGRTSSLQRHPLEAQLIRLCLLGSALIVVGILLWKYQFRTLWVISMILCGAFCLLSAVLGEMQMFTHTGHSL